MPLTSLPTYKTTTPQRFSITMVFRAVLLLGVVGCAGYAVLKILIG